LTRPDYSNTIKEILADYEEEISVYKKRERQYLKAVNKVKKKILLKSMENAKLRELLNQHGIGVPPLQDLISSNESSHHHQEETDDVNIPMGEMGVVSRPVAATPKPVIIDTPLSSRKRKICLSRHKKSDSKHAKNESMEGVSPEYIAMETTGSHDNNDTASNNVKSLLNDDNHQEVLGHLTLEKEPTGDNTKSPSLLDSAEKCDNLQAPPINHVVMVTTPNRKNASKTSHRLLSGTKSSKKTNKLIKNKIPPDQTTLTQNMYHHHHLHQDEDKGIISDDDTINEDMMELTRLPVVDCVEMNQPICVIPPTPFIEHDAEEYQILDVSDDDTNDEVIIVNGNEHDDHVTLDNDHVTMANDHVTVDNDHVTTDDADATMCVGHVTTDEGHVILDDIDDDHMTTKDHHRYNQEQITKSNSKLKLSSGRKLAKGAGLPGFKFHEVFRKKSDRDKLEAVSCPECKEWYQNPVYKDNLQRTCRHRHLHLPPESDPSLWNISFPNSNIK
jgi:cyanate lyase